MGIRRNRLLLLVGFVVLWGVKFGLAGEVSTNDGSISIKDVSISVSSGASVCFTGGLSVTGSGGIVNSGTIWFANSGSAELTLPSSYLGDGLFVFSGKGDCTIAGGSYLANLSMQTSGGNLFLNDNLTVVKSLELKSGLIDASDAKLILESNLPAALDFNNILSSNSYVLGTFERNVMQSSSYFFPVGGVDGFHPFFVQNPVASGTVSVGYDSSVSQTWSSVVQAASFTIEDIGGWRVNSSFEFVPGISLISKNQELLTGADYSILYAQDENTFPTGYTWDQSTLPTDNFYIIGAQRLGAGIYALASQGNMRLINFAYDSGSNDNYFEIPEISNYSRVELMVYNRWGVLVYSNRNYYNDFNCDDYPQGTYFYELKLYQGESVKLVRNIIEIKRENG